MKKATFLAILATVLSVAALRAQQANQNINVLPVYLNDQDDPGLPLDPEAHLKGDLFLQRQVEPTIAVSTRNPDHLIAFFNDYRAVDIPDDPGIGEGSQVAQQTGLLRTLLAKLFGRSKMQPELPAQAAAAEAWVGGSRSYDGGITWSGFFVPGGPFDASPASLASPVLGLEAATDPVASAAPCGIVYVAFVAFTRGDQSKMVVARYQDLNNDEGGDTWVYQGMTVLEEGNNATHGFFIDKPFLIVDPRRPSDASDSCAHNVYASYSTFNGQEKNGKFRSKITFARSADGGQSFEIGKLNAPFHQNQGTWIAVDPRGGMPTSTGGGTIYLFWRHFFNPDAMLMIRSDDFGASFPGNPTQVTGDLNLATFDQPTLTTTAVPNPITDIGFRSNGFPTAAVTADGTVLVAWQERIDIDPTSPYFGTPDEVGSPRIVLMKSSDGGETWADADGVPQQRRAVDFGDRDDPGDPNLPPPGFGALPQNRPSGPQVMPALSCGGGRCMLTYYESRGLIGVDPLSQEELIAPVDVTPTTSYISGIDRAMDLRAAVLDPASGQLVSSTQVSRYLIKAEADFSDGETLDDVVSINGACFPDDPTASVACERRINRFNKPQSASGTSPFMGDYNGLTPVVQFVPDESQGGWRWAINAEDVPYRSFHAIWADNRNLIPPTEPAGEPEWVRYQSYGPPGIGGACINAGAKNTDTLTARVDAELILSAPTTFKQLDSRRSFPLSLMNGTGENRFYRLAITSAAADASFSSQDPDIDQGDVEIFPFSSISQVVYAEAGTAGPIQVSVQEIDGIGGAIVVSGQSGSVTFNPDSTNPVVSDLGDVETLDPFAINPFAINPFAINGGSANTSPSNPFAINPFAINPFAINTTVYDVVDTTWTVTSGNSNTASSYLPLINIDNLEAFLDNYSFQLIIYRTSGNGGLDGCESFNIPQDQIISNIVQDPANPFAINPFAINPFAINPFAINPFAINSTFTLAPSDTSTASSQTGQLRSLASATHSDDGTLKAPRAADAVNITLRAYQLVPDEQLEFVFDPFQDPPSLAVVPLPCDPQNPAPGCSIASTAPDLVPSDLAPPTSAAAAGSVLVFPEGGWTVRNQGNTDATAENRDLRHGFYLSPDDVVDLSLQDEPLNGDILLGFVTSSTNYLAPGDEETLPESILTIPASTPPGDYFLIAVVDDFREVSEVDEVNNTAVFWITVEEPNSAPVAENVAFTVDEDTVLSGTLSASDLDGDPLSITIVSNGSLGTATIIDQATGVFTYTPDAEVSGSDSFTFKANDGTVDSNIATVTVTISGVNDAPTAVDDSAITEEDAAVTVAVLANDGDLDGNLDPVSVAVISPPANGQAAVAAPTAGITYTPNANFNGADSFQYQVCDDGAPLPAECDIATVTVTINAVNDRPTAADDSAIINEDESVILAVLANDGDVDGSLDPTSVTVTSPPSDGTAAVNPATGDISFTPSSDFSGTDALQYQVCDDGTPLPPQCDSATVTVTINAVNDPPVAVPDSLTVEQNSSADVDVVANDLDAEANALILTGVETPANGTATFEGNTVTYTPNVNFVGFDLFAYGISDGLGGTATGTVSVTVQDSVPDFGFLGLQSPWRANPTYSAKVGSSTPLVWQYTDPDTAAVVESSAALPEARIKGPFACELGEDANTVEMVKSPGNSGFQYFASSSTHQFNWDTDGLGAGCYNVRIFSQMTRQLDGPFLIRLRD